MSLTSDLKNHCKSIVVDLVEIADVEPLKNRAVYMLLYHYLLGIDPFLYLIRFALVENGVVLPHCPLCLYIKVVAQLFYSRLEAIMSGPSHQCKI